MQYTDSLQKLGQEIKILITDCQKYLPVLTEPVQEIGIDCSGKLHSKHVTVNRTFLWELIFIVKSL